MLQLVISSALEARTPTLVVASKFSLKNIMKNSQKKLVSSISSKSGFTLIELIIYVAIVSIFMSGAIMFAWDIIYGQAKSQTHQLVNHNIRLVSGRINHEIRQAESITTATGSTLSLVMTDAARNPTVISLDQGKLMMGYGSGGSCPTSSPCALTSDKLTVTELVFTDLSTTGTDHVRYLVTVESQSDRQEWNKTQTYTSSAELR